MGAIIMSYLFIGFFIAIGVTQLVQSLRAHGWLMPTWLAVSLFVLIMLAFVLVPIDARASISPFTQHGYEMASPSP
jgi:predicted PurR-regulated permease PerM